MNNLNLQIGENAGRIWNSLQEGKKSAKELKKALKLKDFELYLSLGWLAREDKVDMGNDGTEIIVTLR